MNSALSNLLLYPFDKGIIDQPSDNSVNLFVNCTPTLSVKLADSISFYASHRRLWECQGSNVLDDIPDKKYDHVFLTMPKNKVEAFYLLSIVSKCLKSNGVAIVVASNDMGGKNLSKWMDEFGFNGECYSKNKCRIYIGKIENLSNVKIEKSYKDGVIQLFNFQDEKYYTQAGIFGWNKVDTGSKLLLENIDDPLKGSGADFGCGYGFLSYKVLSAKHEIKKLHLIDIDIRAISCSRLNTEKFIDEVDIEYHGFDLTLGTPFKEKLDFIVMNPPFHEGKLEKKSLGVSMIETAYGALKKNGALYMVANKQLPYEKTLEKFYKVEKLTEQQGFKVFKALR